MRTRLTIGLVLAIAVGALMVAPTSGASKGTIVYKNVDAINDICATVAEDSPSVEGLDIIRSRWVVKLNGRPSKLFCRFKGAEVDLGAARVVRLRGADAEGLCPLPGALPDEVGELRRARFKMNARGNGFLKCIYEAKA